MSKTFNSVVRTLFVEKLVKRAPQFKSAKANMEFSWPGERAFVWAANPSLYCWISLITSAKGYNEFSLEVGFSRLGRYPQLPSRPSVAGNVRISDVPQEIEFMCSLSSLSTAPAFWSAPAKLEDGASELEVFQAESVARLVSLLETQAMEVAEPLVADAVSKLVDDGIPFLEKVAQR